MEKLKRYLPFLVLGLGVLVLLVAIFVFLNKNKGKVEVNEEVDDEKIVEIPFEKMPFVSLTPSKDGHWLKLSVSGIKIEAKTLDYELLYKLPDGRTQGVPGTVELSSTNFERDILLGSESSGKFRYDEGVKEGTLTLRFRDNAGKLVGKLSGGFTLLSGTSTLYSYDDKFSFELSESPKNVYFVVVNTFGTPVLPDFKVLQGPYGIFSSENKKFSGRLAGVSGDVYRLDGESWSSVNSQDEIDIGIFAFGE